MSINIYAIVTSAVILLLAVLLIILVILQEGSSRGLSGAVGGGSDSFLSKNQSRSMDAVYKKWTKVVAIAFFVLIFACDLLIFIF